MDDKSSELTAEDVSTWLSTYGLITVERIFAQLGFHLSHDELKRAVCDRNSIYHQLLQVPFKNIFNGIILNQASDYREFAQKLFIDFLVSGSANQEEGVEPTHGGAKDLIETERKHLITIGDEFDLQEFEQNKQIAHSQKMLISLCRDHLNSNQPLSQEIVSKINEKMESFDVNAQMLNASLRQFRTQFYDLIIRVREIIGSIPEYRPDPHKISENRILLDFDSKIGEEENIGTTSS